MGYNTTVLILNDAVGWIDQDEEFGRKLKQAIEMAGARGTPDRPIDVSIGGHVNGASVICSHHADQLFLVAIGGNTGHVLGFGHWSNSPHRLMHQLAHQHGFNLVPGEKARGIDQDCDDCRKNALFGLCLDCKTPLNYEGTCPNDPRHRT